MGFLFQVEGIVEERFEMVASLRAELLDYKQRLEHVRLGDEIRSELRPSPDQTRKPRQSLFRKIGAFFFALSRLPQSRRRISALEDDFVSLRNAIINVVEPEFVELSRGMRNLIEITNQLSVDVSQGLAEAKAQSAADAAREAHIIKAIEEQIATLRRQLTETQHILQMERLTRQKAFTNFDRRLMLKGVPNALTAPVPVAAEPSTSVQSLLESFYFLLEERYRGTREEIKQRLLIYRNDLRAARDRVGFEAPVVDIGCGRGELLELLVEDGFKAIGVDVNDMQLDIARRHGGAVIHDDAFAYLGSLEANSVLAVTGIHIVEHIPFQDLVRLMQEVIRVLKKGGVAIFETPNPRNIIVGATNFWFDPTHIRPLPSEVLQLLLETVGFPHVEARPLHPFDTLEYMVKEHNIDRNVASLLYGPQDYAIIGVME